MDTFEIDLSTGEEQYRPLTSQEITALQEDRARGQAALKVDDDIRNAQKKAARDFATRPTASKAKSVSELEDRVAQLEMLVDILIKRMGLSI